MAAHELRQRVHHDVGAPLDRSQQDRRRHRVVDDQRHAVPVGDVGQRLDVADVSRRIADALAEHRPGVAVDQALDGGGVIGLGEPHLDALAGQDVGEQGVGGAVELRHRDDVAAHLGDVDHRIVDGGLAGADAQRLEPALERGDALLQHRIGRVVDAGVAEPVDLEVEQRRPVLGAVERVGDGLIDRHRHRLGGGLDVVAAVDRNGLAFHSLTWWPDPSGPRHGSMGAPSPSRGHRRRDEVLGKSNQILANVTTALNGYRNIRRVTLMCHPHRQ